MTRGQFEHAIRAAGAVLGMNEPHDLWLSKAVAGRAKDIEFCRALVDSGLVSGERLREHLASLTDIADAVRTAVASRIPA